MWTDVARCVTPGRERSSKVQNMNRTGRKPAAVDPVRRIGRFSLDEGSNFTPATAVLRAGNSEAAAVALAGKLLFAANVLGHLEPVQDANVKTGGQTFNTPNLSAHEPIVIDISTHSLSSTDRVAFEKIASDEYDSGNQVWSDIGLPVTAAMGQECRRVIEIKKITGKNLHKNLVKNLGENKGVMDMLIKAEQQASEICSSICNDKLQQRICCGALLCSALRCAALRCLCVVLRCLCAVVC